MTADEPPSDFLIVTCRGCGARWDVDRAPQACKCTDLDDVDWTIHAERPLESTADMIAGRDSDGPSLGGWPESPGPHLVRCDDPEECPVAWAFREPFVEHWHPRPHGPYL